MAVAMAAAPAAPQLNQEPPAAPVDNLLDREVVVLQKLCKEKHSQNGRVVSSLLQVVALVVAIWAGIAAGSWLLGLVIFSVGVLVETVYHNFRNRDYMDASQALQTANFKQYVQRHNLDLSIDSIVGIHKNYKRYLAHLNNEWPNGLPAIPERG